MRQMRRRSELREEPAKPVTNAAPDLSGHRSCPTGGGRSARTMTGPRQRPLAVQIPLAGSVPAW